MRNTRNGKPQSSPLAAISASRTRYAVRFSAPSTAGRLIKVAEANCALTHNFTHVGDLDPAGVLATKKLGDTLRDLCSTRITFERLALSPEQVKKWKLTTRPTKRKDNNHLALWDSLYGKDAESCELDAIPPDDFRALVREAIMRHITQKQLDRNRKREIADRQRLDEIADAEAEG